MMVGVSTDPTDRAAALHEAAMAMHDDGEHRRARATCRKALALFERHAGRRHPDVANVLLELAAIAQDLGDYREGITQAKRALSILAPLRGDVVFDRLRVQALGRLGDLFIARGAYALAEPPLVRALAVAKKKLGPDDAAAAMNGLAILYKYTSRFTEAQRLYRSALAITRRTRGRADCGVAAILHNLGGLEHARGRFAKGEPLARQSVAIRRRALGAGHPDVAADMAALAAILDGQDEPGKRREAETLYRRAIEIFERTLGRAHLEVGFNLGQLAALCHQSGRHAEASSLYRRALRIQAKTLGAQHPVLARTVANFAALRRDQGRARDAEALFRRAYEMFRATLGPGHPETGGCRKDLRAMGRFVFPNPGDSATFVG